MKKPSGSRVVAIQVRCASCKYPSYQALDQSNVYKVILSSYMAGGGAGLSVIAKKKLSHQVGNITDDQVMVDYFKTKSPILTGVENRITFVDERDKPCVSGGNLPGFAGFPLVFTIGTLYFQL